jgi:hypothetical protein
MDETMANFIKYKAPSQDAAIKAIFCKAGEREDKDRGPKMFSK